MKVLIAILLVTLCMGVTSIRRDLRDIARALREIRTELIALQPLPQLPVEPQPTQHHP
jgi:hypothetical protein